MENNLEVAPRSSLEQQDVADSEFVKLDDVLMDKAQNIPKKNVESLITSLSPKLS